MAYKEIFNMIEGSETLARNLADQIANPKKTYGFS